MKMQILRYIIPLILNITLAFAQETVSHPYYPLSVGAEWHYGFEDGGGLHRTVEKTVGDTLFYIQEIMYSDLSFETLKWEKLVVRKSGIYMVAFKSMDDPEYIELNPPRLILPMPLKVGIKWEHGNDEYEVIEHQQDPSTKYKIYEDMYIIQTETSTSDLKQRYYYAREQGLAFSSMKSQSFGKNWIWGLTPIKSKN